MLSGPFAHDHSDIVLEAAARHANGVYQSAHRQLWHAPDRGHELRAGRVLEESIRRDQQAAAERYRTERDRVGSAAAEQWLAYLLFGEVDDTSIQNEPGCRIAYACSRDMLVSDLDHDSGRQASVACSREHRVDALEAKRPSISLASPECGNGSIAYGLGGERSPAGSACTISDNDQ
jgi:hypothetical protein